MIQSIEVNYFAYENMFCMFCGVQVLFEDGSITACPHVLFIATSEGGYEYGPDESPVGDILPSFDSEKSYLDQLKEVNEFPEDSFMVEIYTPAPSGMEAYVGFSSSTS